VKEIIAARLWPGDYGLEGRGYIFSPWKRALMLAWKLLFWLESDRDLSCVRSDSNIISCG